MIKDYALSLLKWLSLAYILFLIARKKWGLGQGGSFLDALLGLFSSDPGNSGSNGVTNGGTNGVGLIIGALEPDDIVDYQSQYFTPSEYFGTSQIPSNKLYNYKRLFVHLDKIRELWGSPIYIYKGFSKYPSCNEVQIQPQNLRINDLYSLIQEKTNGGMFSFSEVVKNNNNKIYLKI